MSPPYDLSWEIFENSVRLTWKHSDVDEPPNGYYVEVRSIDAMHEQTGPDFIHLNEDVRYADIQGLIPNTDYKVKARN